MILILLILIIVAIFRAWFMRGIITAGDMSFFFNEQVAQYFNLPFMWETFRNSGLGGNSFLHHGVYLYNLPFSVLQKFLDYDLVQRIIWFLPLLVGGVLTSLYLIKTTNLVSKRYHLLASLIFILNTYVLMVIGGGQLTVAQAYILFPLGAGIFLKTIQTNSSKAILSLALFFSLLFIVDFRFAYMFLILMFAYTFYALWSNFSFSNVSQLTKKIVKIVTVCFFVTVLTQSFWMLPLHNFLTRSKSVEKFSQAYISAEVVKFFSFANFSNSISLLHPNWPENIFGKIFFLQPEFLILAIAAFASLLFILQTKPKQQNLVLFLALTGLVGAFLAKGANPPFGQIYVYLFRYLPGFIMFRDSTKFYTLVALSFSILIPFTIYHVSEVLEKKVKLWPFSIILPLVFISFWLFTIRQALVGQLGGTFTTRQIPREYVTLKEFLVNQPTFFRTLWVPQKARFGFYSDTHPAISLREMLNGSDVRTTTDWLHQKDAADQLERWGVKYVIVPLDSEGEIFLEDRRYSEKKYQETINEIKTIQWLTPITNFDKIAVFQTPVTFDHFWISHSNQSKCETPRLHYSSINPTKYIVDISRCKREGLLIFSESFDPLWVVTNGKKMISSSSTFDNLNSFPLTPDIPNSLTIEYVPQRYVLPGLIISGISLFTMILYLLTPFIRDKIWYDLRKYR